LDRIRKPEIYPPKQARKVIKPTTKEKKIGFISCPSYTRKSKLNKELKRVATMSSFHGLLKTFGWKQLILGKSEI
jgi:hypothetical protein